jgi:hypothetical protein
MNYTNYLCHIILTDGTGRMIAVVASSIESAIADCRDAFEGIADVQAWACPNAQNNATWTPIL